jgi:hypothetical protein
MILGSENNNETNRPILLSDEEKQLGRDLYKLYTEIISDAERIKKYYKLNNATLQYENGSCDNLICYLALRKKNIGIFN